MYTVVGIISSQNKCQLRSYLQYREVKSRSGIVQKFSVVVCWVAITVKIQYSQDSVRSRYSTVKTHYGQDTVRSRHSTVKIQYGQDTVRSRYSKVKTE